jgi:rhamnogalacturonan endolyase
MKILLLTALLTATTMAASAQITPISQMEKLDRGLVAIPMSATKNFVSWRFLGSDSESATLFDIIRDGKTIAENVKVTNYTDNGGSATSEYQIVTKVNGEVTETSKAIKPWGNIYLEVKLQRPSDGKTKPYKTSNTINKVKVEENYPDGQDYSYTPNDCSVGDVDGDGQYELFVKWDPSNSRDNSHNGVTGNVIIDCYRLDGTLLWRVDLGKNIRAGAHYTQFQVYDYDGDGKAEMMCKTAPGSKDGKGNYVNQAATDDKIKIADNSKDWVTEGSGRINGGHEYLTVFNGEAGEAIHTIAYYPNRNAKCELSEAEGSYNWDSRSGKSDKGSYGNRGERYLAATAYLDGPEEKPSGIFCRGYYSYAYVWAVDFDGQQLHPRWLHASTTTSSYSVTTWDANGKASIKNYSGCKPTSGSGSGTMMQNGNHNMSIADVDGDGSDEIIWGAAGCDHDGRLLYGTGFGHGDAIHLGDLDPDRPGLEVFDVHEEKGTYAWDIHDAATGEIISKGGQSGQDNGRGCAADIVAGSRGYEFWSAYGGFDSGSRNQNPFNVQTSKEVGTNKPSMNFRIYWDGDLQDELLDGTTISKYNGSTLGVNGKPIGNLGSPSSCNSTKSTPCLSVDLFGDWREEVILWSTKDNATLNIYTTTTTSKYRVPTLMHDHTYRMGIAWQNTAYNQPPHLGYYLPDYIDGKLTNNVQSVATQPQQTKQVFDLLGRKLNSLKPGLNIIREGGKTKKVFF